MSELDEFQGFIQNQQDNAVRAAIPGVDDDPERAAQAMELARHTGLSPILTYHNYDNTESQFRNALTNNIIRNNSHLQAYINSNPMAAKVSADDWGNLNDVSGHLDRFTGPSAAEVGWETFKQEMSGPVGRWMFNDTKQMQDFTTNHPGYGAALAVPAIIGAPLEGPLRTMGSAMAGGAAAVRQTLLNRGVDEKTANQIEEFLGIAPLAAGMDFRHVPEELNKLAKDANRTAAVTRPYLDSGKVPPVGVDELVNRIYQEQSKMDLDSLQDALKSAQQSATRERDPDLFAEFIRHKTDATIGIDADTVRKLYGDSTPMPDDGLLGWVPGIEDQLIGTQTGGDIRVPLADWLAHMDPDVAKELHDFTRVRASGLTLDEMKEKVHEPLAQREDEGNIEITPTKWEGGTDLALGTSIAKTAKKVLTVDGEPAAELNLIQNKDGSPYIQSIQTYPEFKRKGYATALMQDLQREFPNQDFQTSIKTKEGSAFFNSLDNVRDSAGLRIAEQREGEQKLGLQKVSQGTGRFANVHDYDFVDEKGNRVGDIQLTYDEAKKDLHVEYVRAEGGPQAFGSATTRDLLRQLKKEFPEAQTISGTRVSGARERSVIDRGQAPGVGPENFVGEDVTVPLRQAEEHLPSFVSERGGQPTVDGGWRSVAGSEDVEYKPELNPERQS